MGVVAQRQTWLSGALERRVREIVLCVQCERVFIGRARARERESGERSCVCPQCERVLIGRVRARESERVWREIVCVRERE